MTDEEIKFLKEAVKTKTVMWDRKDIRAIQTIDDPDGVFGKIEIATFSGDRGYIELHNCDTSYFEVVSPLYSVS